MKDAIEDLMHEAEIVIRDAYQRGFNNGNVSNKAILESKKDMLKAFDSYANKYIRLTEKLTSKATTLKLCARVL